MKLSAKFILLLLGVACQVESQQVVEETKVNVPVTEALEQEVCNAGGEEGSSQSDVCQQTTVQPEVGPYKRFVDQIT